MSWKYFTLVEAREDLLEDLVVDVELLAGPGHQHRVRVGQGEGAVVLHHHLVTHGRVPEVWQVNI